MVANLDGLSKLESLGGLLLENNAQLGDLSALSRITRLEGELRIRNNPLLGNLRGLHNVDSIGRELHIEFNELLGNLDGLNNVRNAGGLRILNNGILKNIDGLENLKEILGRLVIERNPTLTSLRGLNRLEDVFSVHILFNLSLPRRLALAFVNSLLEQEFSPFIEIFGNRPDPTMEFEIIPAEEAIELQTRLVPADDAPLDLRQAPLILTTPVIEVPPTLALRSIIWKADIPPGTHIEVHTRTGDALIVQEVRYYDRNGVELTEARWDRLPSFSKGDRVETTRLEGDNWSTWSTRNRFSGEAFRSPTTRQVLQAQIILSSKEAGLVPVLHSLGFLAAPPTAIVESHNPTLPRVLALEQNFPNPFNSTTTLSIALPAPENVELAIFNMAGQKVAVLVQGRRPAGMHTVWWDGHTDDGQSLASGVYLYRLRAGDEVKIRRLLLLR